MIRISITLIILVLTLFLFTGCVTETEKGAELYQVSTLQALIVGDYDGSITVEELLKHGDTGLGTFAGLDGEMIVLEGKVYKAAYNGDLIIVSNDETIPFANVAFMNSSEKIETSFTGGIDALKNEIDTLFPQENMPVLFCITGDFTDIEFRSVPKQEKPYPLLTEVVKEQAVFKKVSASGTMVGFRLPSYMSDINAVGYHLHFISADKTFGGHLLNVQAGTINISAETLNELKLILPESLKTLNLESTTEEDVAAVEKSK